MWRLYTKCSGVQLSLDESVLIQHSKTVDSEDYSDVKYVESQSIQHEIKCLKNEMSHTSKNLYDINFWAATIKRKDYSIESEKRYMVFREKHSNSRFDAYKDGETFYRICNNRLIRYVRLTLPLSILTGVMTGPALNGPDSKKMIKEILNRVNLNIPIDHSNKYVIPKSKTNKKKK